MFKLDLATLIPRFNFVMSAIFMALTK